MRETDCKVEQQRDRILIFICDIFLFQIRGGWDRYFRAIVRCNIGMGGEGARQVDRRWDY